MTIASFLIVYAFGGLTFIPLLLAAVLIPAWLVLPRSPGSTKGHRGDGTGVLGDGHEDSVARESLRTAQEEQNTLDGAASATFAVLRAFNFTVANDALIAKEKSNAATMGSSGTVDGTGDLREVSSESVYQSMYRTVFDRSKRANGAPSVLANENAMPTPGSGASTPRVKRKPVAATVFHIVLRHGHLMLYDSPKEVEVKHVISLAHHAISLSEGEDEEEVIKDADLFIKRTAIVLTPMALPNGYQQGPSAPPKPFYLFSTNCSEKEDFYHALLSTRNLPPIPLPLIPEDAIKLQSTLHSTSLTPETRAFNALVSRIFLAINRTPMLEDLIRTKIEKKIARVQKPSFLASLTVESIDLGDAAPTISNPRLKDLNISGELTLAFDIRYNGGVRVGIAAVATLDLGPRFKARSVDLVLATSLQRLSGHMLVRVKPPPSNRIWFCFDGVPEMDIKVEPIVSTRQITYTFILRQIEDRIRSVVAETLVKPNWDDVPFFDTRSQRVRGGIWSDEGAEDDIMSTDRKTSTSDIVNSLRGQNSKTMSMPSLPTNIAEGESSGSDTAMRAASIASSSSRDKASAGNVKRRSVASLPAQGQAHNSTEHYTSTPLRSPSLSSPSPSIPSVALNQADVAPVRADDATLQPSTRGLWRARPQRDVQTTKREAVEAMREMRDRTAHVADKPTSEDSIEQPPVAIIDEDGSSMPIDPSEASLWEDFNSSRGELEPPDRQDTLPPVVRSPRRTDSERSTATSSSSNTGTAAQRRQEQRKNLLAATAAATNAAKTWGWNALASRNKGGSAAPQQQHPVSQGQPIGRGQPLPPPGVPLPGPPKQGIFAAAAGLGVGSVKRKPVKPPLPARRPATSISQEELGDALPLGGHTNGVSELGSQHGGSHESIAHTEEAGQLADESEFGPWNENSGIISGAEAEAAGDTQNSTEVVNDGPNQPSSPRSAKVPPPLPARRRSRAQPELTVTSYEHGESHDEAPDMSVHRDNQMEVTQNDVPSAYGAHHDVENSSNDEVPETDAKKKFTDGQDVDESDFQDDQDHQTPSIQEKTAEEAGGHTAHFNEPHFANMQPTVTDGDEPLPAQVDMVASDGHSTTLNTWEDATLATNIVGSACHGDEGEVSKETSQS